MTGSLGEVNDYNPLQGEGLPPNCSLVFDASGNDVVYLVQLNPGESIRLQLTFEEFSAIPAMYFLDRCPEATWPDLDGGELCGDNEYITDGFCQANTCLPLDWTFTWPSVIGGEATQSKTLFLVLDEINATTGGNFTLDWVIESP